MEKIKHYQLLELLKEDEVFKEYIAYSTVEKKLVRIKILQEILREDEIFVSNLKRVLQVSSLFSSEKISKVLKFFHEKEIFYIVEEYEEGEYLENILKEKSLTESDIQNYILQVCEAIKYFESKNLIHGGISPSSIWINKNKEVKITNFGIIPLLVQTEKKIFYNVNYIPPEQIITKTSVKTADIFATGKLFLEMLTGSPQAEPPLEFVNIINKACNKNPNLRYQSIEEFAEDLRKIFEKSAITFKEEERKEVREIIKEIKLKPKKTEVKKGIFSCILAVFVFMVISILSIWGIYIIFFPSAKEVIVPDLKGKDLIEAEQILKENSLKMNVIGKEYSDEYPENKVISQAPLPGAKRKQGRVVNLVVSLGPEKVIVPDLTNKKLKEAKIELEKLNLKIGKEEYQPSEEIPEGVIIAQEPLPNTQVFKNTTVNLVISSGKEIAKVEVPDLKGMTLEEVRQMLPTINLKIGVIKKVFKSDVPEGIIISQHPIAGTTVDQDTPVNLIVSAGIKKIEEEKEADVLINIPPGISKKEVKVIVIDSRGTRTVYQKNHSPGEEVRVPVKGIGKTTIQVFIGGELIKEEQL